MSNYRLPEHRNGESFINFIENIANQTIQLAKDAIKVLQARIDQLLLDIRDKLFGIQQTGDDALNELLKDVEKFSGENTRSGIGSCVQNHMDEIRQIIATGREDMLKCIQEAMNEADTISQSLFPYVESISTLIKNVSGIIDQCSASSNPFSVAICISQHVRVLLSWSNGLTSFRKTFVLIRVKRFIGIRKLYKSNEKIKSETNE